MPTSKAEANTIMEIIDDFLSPEQAKEITKRLEKEVGKETDNDSLKVSLKMLKSLYHDVGIRKERKQFLRLLLFSVIMGHAAIIILNVATLFILPFYVSWYIALPVMTLIVNLIFSPISCPLTKLESRIRRELGYPEVRFFIKHYLLDPVRKLINKPPNEISQ